MYKIFLYVLLICSVFWQQASSSTLSEEQAESSSKSEHDSQEESQLQYYTVRIETDKGEGAGFRFDFPVVGDPLKSESVPCLVMNKHLIEEARNAIFYFPGAISPSANSPKKKKVFLESEALKAMWFLHPQEEIDLCAIPLIPIIKKLKLQQDKDSPITPVNNLIPTEEVLNKLSSFQEKVSVFAYPTGHQNPHKYKPFFRHGFILTQSADFQFMIFAETLPSNSLVFTWMQTTEDNKNLERRKFLFLGIVHSISQMRVEETIVTENNSIRFPLPGNVKRDVGYIIKASQLNGLQIPFEKTEGGKGSALSIVTPISSFQEHSGLEEVLSDLSLDPRVDSPASKGFELKEKASPEFGYQTSPNYLEEITKGNTSVLRFNYEKKRGYLAYEDGTPLKAFVGQLNQFHTRYPTKDIAIDFAKGCVDTDRIAEIYKDFTLGLKSKIKAVNIEGSDVDSDITEVLADLIERESFRYLVIIDTLASEDGETVSHLSEVSKDKIISIPQKHIDTKEIVDAFPKDRIRAHKAYFKEGLFE